MKKLVGGGFISLAKMYFKHCLVEMVQNKLDLDIMHLFIFHNYKI